MMEPESFEKVAVVCDSVGLAYAGLGPDLRHLLKRARKEAQKYFMVYDQDPPVSVLVKDIATSMQEFTQSGGVRPFGVSILLAGCDDLHGPGLFQLDPSGAWFAWKATAIGKNMASTRTFLEKRYSEEMELEDAIQTALLALKEGFDGQLNEGNIEVGIIDSVSRKFRLLTPSQVKDYLDNIL